MELPRKTGYDYVLEKGNSIDLPDRTDLTTRHIIEEIWTHLNLPPEALQALHLEGRGHILPSSFRIADLSQSTIALSALAASLFPPSPSSRISVDRTHAAIEFASERLYSIDGNPAKSGWGPLGGLHQTRDGFVRIHDSFPNHRSAALSILGLDGEVSREDVAEKIGERRKMELEDEGRKNGAVVFAVRSYDEWDVMEQAKVLPEFPVEVKRISSGPPDPFTSNRSDRCLSGLRVLELSRVIAAPVAGRTLAAYGAEVLWITSPNLPDLPSIDKDVSRGKRTIQLDLNTPDGMGELEDLVKEADVILQSYRPGSIAAKGLSMERLAKMRPGIIVANLSAWGSEGPWRGERGFDSIVQNVSGINCSEAAHSSPSSTAKPLPLQALDHAAGYLLATGILAALHKRSTEGGSWEVNVSLAGVGKYLRSLGQVPGRSGFEVDGVKSPEEWLAGREGEFLEEKMSGLGVMKAVKHAAKVEGQVVGFEVMPKALGSDRPEWS